ncbi:MAG: tripartite tricarboxylate transporter substrate binding protein [Acidobacteria bacterium]|nr:tripartite tricarboxylate transporter substrate binding protein [Acidobacteriota bacterium]
MRQSRNGVSHHWITALLLATALATPASAQIKMLTIVAPAAPGGGWDQTAREMQQVIEKNHLANAAKVVNIPGAGGTIGLAQFVASNKGNGDVLMAMGLIMVGAVLTNQSPVTLRQVTPIARLTGEYEVLVVPAASPFKSLGEFLQAWKQDPGKYAIAGGSAGGTDHMLAGLLAKSVGIDVTKLNYIPHSGGGESIASLVGNHLPVGVNGLAEMVPFIKTGRLRALAISSEKRLVGMDIPTFVEQGVDLTLANWRGVVAPPGISAQQRAALAALVDRMVKSPGWRAALAKNDWIDMYQSGAEFEEFLQQEDLRATAVLKSIGLVK